MLSTTDALVLGLSLGALFGAFAGVCAAKLDRKARGPWPITRIASYDLHWARRVIGALADEVSKDRPSLSGPDIPSPDTDVLRRILTASRATEEDLWNLTGALRDLTTYERTRPGLRGRTGEER